jgi:hypothetical protein
MQPSILKVETLEDLQGYLLKQKDFSEKAKRELSRVSDYVPILYASDGTLAISTTEGILKGVGNLLHNYASLPTLSEFAASPVRGDIAKWGGSFGVSVVIGTVVLKTLVESFPEFNTSVKPIFIKVLRELYVAHESKAEDATGEQSMMERVMENLNFSIKDKNGREILGEQRTKIIRNRVALLLEVIAKILEDYKLTNVTREDDQISSSMTPLGIRVFLHIIDVERYTEEVALMYRDLSVKKVTA